MPKVKNINGTTDNTCKCGSWLKHWGKFSGKTAYFCSEKTCIQKDLVGAHAQKTTSDMSWYIIPLCKAHNSATGVLEVGDATVFVAANKSETCDKNNY